MPELPEVEVVRHGLQPAVTGARITAVEVLDERSLKRHDGPVEDFVDRLTGARLLGAVRRGKFLWLPLDEPGGEPSAALVTHLGMSGQVLLRDPAAKARFLVIRLSITTKGTRASSGVAPRNTSSLTWALISRISALRLRL